MLRIAILSLAFACAAAPVSAQAPAAARVEDAALARARAAWEALPLAERMAIQDDLVWVTQYRGVKSGEFGRLTFNALRALTAQRAGGDAILTPADRAALAAEAEKARASIAFAPVSDSRSGAAIGVPRKLLPRRMDIATGARFESPDRAAALETFRLRASDTPLAALFEALRAPQPNRRVTYSVLRPDFFVIVAETPSQAFYIRAARGLDGAEPQVRGFRLVWPKAQQARYEAIAVAVSNSFEPFGHRPETAEAAKAPARPPAPAGDHAASIALALGADRFVTFMPGGVCEAARIGDRPARLLRHDAPSGLALFEAPGAKAQRLALPAAATGAAQQALVVFAQEIGPTVDMSAAPGETTVDSGALRLRAALPAQIAGALVLSRDGRILGLAPPLRASAPNAAAPASRPLTSADKILAFAESTPSSEAPPQSSAAALTAAVRPSLDALWCKGEARAAAN